MTWTARAAIAALVVIALPAAVNGQDLQQRSGTISVPGAELPYVVEGEGRPCIVYGSHLYYPRTFSETFKRSLRCAHISERAFLPNAGRPEGRPFTINEAVADIEAARRQLGLEDFVLVGHSIHGLIALAYAAAHPDHVSHVIALGAPPAWPAVADSMSAYRDRHFVGERLAKHRENMAALDSLLAAHPGRAIVARYIANGAVYWYDPGFDSAPLWEGVEINADLVNDLFATRLHWAGSDDVDVPIFVGLGKYDFSVPPNLWSGARTPFGDLTVSLFERAGHTPQLEEAQEFDRRVLRWINTTRGREPPAPRIYHSMVTLGEGSHLALGGVTRHGWTMDLLDVWLLESGNGSWTRLAEMEPGDLYAAAYDRQSNRVITLNLRGQTWAFDPEAAKWELRAPPDGPSGRCGHRLTYDEGADRVILFGGFTPCRSVRDSILADTWAYDYEADRWELRASTDGPSRRLYHAMTYDPVGRRTVVWGGRVEEEDPDIWAYSYEADAWERIRASGGPQGIRAYHSFTYDPRVRGIVLFGGLVLEEALSFDGDLRGDTWVVDLERGIWRQLDSEASPSPRSHHAAVFDEHHGRVLVFGGELGSSYSGVLTDEIWLFDSVRGEWSRGLERQD